MTRLLTVVNDASVIITDVSQIFDYIFFFLKKKKRHKSWIMPLKTVARRRYESRRMNILYNIILFRAGPSDRFCITVPRKHVKLIEWRGVSVFDRDGFFPSCSWTKLVDKIYLNMLSKSKIDVTHGVYIVQDRRHRPRHEPIVVCDARPCIRALRQQPKHAN